MITYITYINELFLIYALSYLTGNFFLKNSSFKVKNNYTTVFLSIVLGVLIITILQAIVSTKLNTVLLIVPILIALGYFFDSIKLSKNPFYRQNLSSLETTGTLRILFEVSFLIIALYSIQFILLFQDGVVSAIRLASQDITFYARCADYLRTSGIEVCNNDYLFSASSKPYHYGDLWFTAAISSINRHITVMSLILTVKTIYLVLIYLGLVAIVEIKYQLNYKIKIVCALSVFFTPINIEIYSNISILQDMAIFSQTLYQAQKLFYVQILLLASIVLNLVGYKKLGFASIICIPILYTVTILPLLAAFFLYIIYGYITKNKVDPYEWLLVLIASLYLLIYYFIFNSSGEDVNPYPTNLLDLINFKHTINIIGGTILKHIILFFPIGILLICYIKNNKSQNIMGELIKENPNLIFILGMPFTGLILWSVTSGYINAVQFFQNISMPIFYTGAILILITSYIELTRRYKYLILFFLVLTFGFQIKNTLKISPTHGTSFIEKIRQKEIVINNIYVVYKPASWYRSIFQFGDKGINLGNYLTYVKNNMQPVSLDMIETPIIGDSNYVRTANESLRVSTFYRYVEGKKKVGVNKTSAEYQLDFIRENNIRLLVTLKSVDLPKHLERLVINRIEDDVSDEVLCILSYSFDHQSFDGHS